MMPRAAERVQTRFGSEERARTNSESTLVLSEGLRPSDSPTRSLARRFAGPLRSRGSLAVLARDRGPTFWFMRQLLVLSEGLRPSDSPTRSLARRFAGPLRSWPARRARSRPRTDVQVYETATSLIRRASPLGLRD